MVTENSYVNISFFSMYLTWKEATCASCSFVHHFHAISRKCAVRLQSLRTCQEQVILILIFFFFLCASISLLAMISIVRSKAVDLRAWVSHWEGVVEYMYLIVWNANSANILQRAYSPGSQVLNINIACTFTPLYESQILSWSQTWSRSDFKNPYSDVSHIWATTLVNETLFFSW